MASTPQVDGGPPVTGIMSTSLPNCGKGALGNVETPIIACNDSFNLPTGRIRRPSTPNKKNGIGGPIGSLRKGRDDKKSQGSRIRSASAGRDHKTEVSFRYWAYLFENLERSISEIYEGCEKEENIRQCKEVMLILENYTRDFSKLIEWFHLKWSYEKTPPPNRPQALAWEIRKPSLCMLPHTLAYEKLLALRDPKPSSGMSVIGSISSDSSNSACVGVAAPEEQPRPNSAPSSGLNSNKTSDPLQTNFVPNLNPITVDIGLQTDLEEDPDVFYFAGGRIVASQTDPSPDYGPLIPIPFSKESNPVIIVLSGSLSSDSDDDNSEEPPNINCVTLCETTTTQKSTKTKASRARVEIESSEIGPEPNNNNLTINVGVRPVTPIETKSSSTQLSAGVLIADESAVSPLEKELEADGQKNESTVTSGGVTSPKTTLTFAEKARNGMLRQNQNQAKSVSSYLNKVGVGGSSGVTATGPVVTKGLSNFALNKTSKTSGRVGVNIMSRSTGVVSSVSSVPVKPTSGGVLRTSRSGTGTGGTTSTGPIIPNYRSNIASRCRTAVNTGQLPETPSSLGKTSTKDKANNKFLPPPTSSSSCLPLSAADTSLVSCKGAPPALTSLSVTPTPLSSASSTNSKAGQESLPQVSANKSRKTSIPVSAGANAALSCQQVLPTQPTVSFSTSTSKSGGILGIIRSKSMINPPGGGVSSSKRSAGPITGPKRTNSGGIGFKSGSFKRLHSNSYISLPDESSYQKKSHTIDADGWETVKTRSSRGSKWSSSNSSLGSSIATNNQSRNSLDKGTPQKPRVSDPAVPSSGPSPTLSSDCVIQKPSAPQTLTSTSSKATPREEGKKRKSPSKSKKSGADFKKNAATTTAATPSTENAPTEGTGDAEARATPTPTDDRTLLLDDEEIQKKEADLDDAIREEEAIEEELRQVEKDFERIENDSATATDSEAAVSPDPEVIDDAQDVNIDEMDDEFFFVRMDGQANVSVEDMPPREPGRILTLREKLMSPAKKADGAETLKRVEAKLAKAERNRENLLQAKFNRYVELSDRFESLNETTKKLVAERADLIIKAEKRRKRAAEKRQEYIKNIQRKGHDEDLKAKEIAFINLLEAQNKRHDYFASAQEVEERLQTIQDERRQRLEDRAGKSSAVISRQSRIRRDWQVKLTTLQEKRRKANERITREKEERAKERSEMAQEKARDREERISALNAAKQAEKEELQKKIRTKQAETARRHEENMESIRQKAAELGAPRVQEENGPPSSYRVCTLCSVIIHSGIHEMQHIRSRGHLEAVKKADKSSHPTSLVAGGEASELNGNSQVFEGFGFKFIADVGADKIANKIVPDRNRNKGLKKHSKKLMQKLMESGLLYEKSSKDDGKETGSLVDPQLRAKTRRNILELDRLISLFNSDKGSPTLATGMDRIMVEIRKTSVQNIYMKDAIIGMNGLEVALKVLQCSAADLPPKSKILAIEMIHGFIHGSLVNGLYILRGTGICTLMNLCAERWSTLIPDDNRWLCRSPLGPNESLPTDYFIQSVVGLLYNLIQYVPDPFNGIVKKGSFLTQDEIKGIKDRTFDIMGYLVASGVIDRISVYCSGVRGPVDDSPEVAALLQVFLDFLVVLVYTLQFCWGENPAGCIMTKKESDGTQLLAALEASELAGAVSMSYSLLLHQGAPSRPRAVDGINSKINTDDLPPPPGEKTAEIVKSTLCLINAMARLDLVALQNVLASEAVSLQFRHIASQLLWQVVPHRHSPLMRRLLTELIISIGNFTVGNKHNQATIQSGQTPTVLQLLCTLPLEYFNDDKFKHNFISTLLAATEGCPENKEILVQNRVDLEMLQNYLMSEDGKKNVIVRRMIHVTSQQRMQQEQLLINAKSLTQSESKSKSTSERNNKQLKKSTKSKVKPLEESNISVNVNVVELEVDQVKSSKSLTNL